VSDKPTAVPPRVAAFLNTHSIVHGVEEQMKAPRFVMSKLGCFIWNRVFSCIGFPHVNFLDAKDEKGNNVYRLDFVVFGIRTHYICFTPVMAHTVGFLLFALTEGGDKPRDITLLSEQGLMHIPKWAMREVLDHLRSICNANEAQLESFRAELHRLMEEEEPVLTTQDIIKAGKEPTLH
jgi:hypothetical protein